MGMLETNSTPLSIISGFRPIQIGQRAGEQGGDHAAEEHGGDDDGKLARIQARRCLEIRQSARDDADIHAVEQSAESRDQQEEAVVAGFFVVGHSATLLL